MFWRVAHVRHGDGTYFSQFLSHAWMVTRHDPGTETTSGASTLKSSHWAYWVNGKKKQNMDFAHPALKVLMIFKYVASNVRYVYSCWWILTKKSFRFYIFYVFYIFLHILRCFRWEFNGLSRFRNNRVQPLWPTEKTIRPLRQTGARGTRGTQRVHVRGPQNLQ